MVSVYCEMSQFVRNMASSFADMLAKARLNLGIFHVTRVCKRGKNPPMHHP